MTHISAILVSSQSVVMNLCIPRNRREKKVFIILCFHSVQCNHTDVSKHFFFSFLISHEEQKKCDRINDWAEKRIFFLHFSQVFLLID